MVTGWKTVQFFILPDSGEEDGKSLANRAQQRPVRHWYANRPSLVRQCHPSATDRGWFQTHSAAMAFPQYRPHRIWKAGSTPLHASADGVIPRQAHIPLLLWQDTGQSLALPGNRVDRTRVEDVCWQTWPKPENVAKPCIALPSF